MLEIFGSEEEVLKDILENDRYYEKIDVKDYEILYEMAKSNAECASGYALKKGLTLDNLRSFVEQFTRLNFSNQIDMLAYSDIRFPKNEINIYMHHINSLFKEFSNEISSIDFLINIFILHEYYHYIEENVSLDFKEFKISTINFSIFKNEISIQAVSEMSAFLFMRSFINNPRQYLGGNNNETEIFTK